MARRPTPSVKDYLSELQIQCIGLITAEWAHLEATVSIAIWEYCDLEREQGLCVTADLSSLNKINILGALTKLHFTSDDPVANEISEIVKRMEKLNTERNNIVHNLWGQNAMAGKILSNKTSTRSAKLTQRLLSYTDEELMELVQSIEIAIGDLYHFLDAHVPGWRSGKPRPKK